jgi:hypothetical protein
METKRENTKQLISKARPLIILLAILFLVSLAADQAWAQQKKKQAGKKARAQQFIDEDGDGFNDLLPDDDGDGIPNMIDPDYKGHSAESLYMHRYMNGQTIEAERHRYQDMNQHGEPGQYGPNDSTGHGQGDGRGGHHGNPDSGNQGGNQDGQGGQGGQGGNGGGEGDGGNGGGPGVNPGGGSGAGQSGNVASGQSGNRQSGANVSGQKDNRKGVNDNQPRDPEPKKGQGNQGGRGGHQ